jgi:hypothetical protein
MVSTVVLRCSLKLLIGLISVIRGRLLNGLAIAVLCIAKLVLHDVN